VDSLGSIGSDHAAMYITLALNPVYNARPSIKPGSDAYKAFIKDVRHAFLDARLNPFESIEQVNDTFTTLSEKCSSAFNDHSSIPHITSRSRPWWNDECKNALLTFRQTRTHDDRVTFYKCIKRTQRAFFDNIIQNVIDRSLLPSEVTCDLQVT
jgi:hypothetical protein